MINETKLFGVYKDKKRIYTKNLFPGNCVYGESIVKEKGVEFREWDHKKSKLGAYIMKGAGDIFIRPKDKVLYLGIASGTTASHISDIIGKEGMIFGVDPAFRCVMNLVFLCQVRNNIAPIMGDAAFYDSYKDKVPNKVDVVFQDIAQKNQAEIFINNVERYLKKGGFGLLSVKARSVDVSKKPKEVFNMVRKKLEEKFTIVDYKTLDPYEKNHALFSVKKK